LEEKLKKYNETLEEQVRLRSEEITGERKKSEIALLSERKRLYEILDTLPAMISLLTPDYQIAFANRIFLHKFGELKGRPCYEHCYNNNEPCEFCQAFNVLKTGKPHNWEVSLPDGTILDVNDFPFTDIDGSPRILEIDFDITKQKTAEAELRGQKEYLFNLNEEILRSNKELESFAYITSHDLQEPLRMMTSFAQLLALKYKGQLDKTGEEYIDFIVGGAKRMYDLINGLLAYSRISRKEVAFSKVDINNVIETVKANLDIVIKERNCTIDYVNLPVIVSDRNQLIQLFQNLISNAIKFSRRNPHITISAKKAKSEYIFSVKDRGIGIEPQYFEKIFEIFKRLNTRVEFEGTGIGLAICKKIVENHNGRIWVESEPSKGSVFHFTIPLNIKK
jgi:signal transduction histidine kinase